MKPKLMNIRRKYLKVEELGNFKLLQNHDIDLKDHWIGINAKFYNKEKSN